MEELIKELDIGSGYTLFGMLSYGDKIESLYHLGSLRTEEQALKALEDIKYVRGKTQTDNALYTVSSSMFSSRYERRRSANILILVTNGGATDQEETYRRAIRAKEQGIHIIVITAGKYVNIPEIQSMTSHPIEKNVLAHRDFRRIKNSIASVKDIICNSKYYFIKPLYYLLHCP